MAEVQLLRTLQGAPELRLTCCDLSSQVATGSQDGASSLRRSQFREVYRHLHTYNS